MAASNRPRQLDEAEGRARELRDQLGLGSEAIGDLFELLEHLGLAVIRRPMEENGPDGFYLRTAQLVVVAINSSMRLGRQRFTAAHELAHHLFDQGSHIDRNIFEAASVMERRANAFAAFFLMPREGVDRWLRRGRPADNEPANAEAVVHLARHFGMSYEATLYQLRDLGRISAREVATLKEAEPERIARRLGYDVDADERQRHRLVLPSDYLRRALLAYGAGDISAARLAELLRTDEPTASRIVEEAGIEPPRPSLEELIEEARRA